MRQGMPCLYVIAAVVIQNQYFSHDISTAWVEGVALIRHGLQCLKAEQDPLRFF